MVGLLTALPNTQLTRRLEAEGRLQPLPFGKGDQCSGGLNFVTLRPRRDVLADFRAVLANVYEPAAYFERVRVLGRMLDRPASVGGFSLAHTLRELKGLARLLGWVTFRRTDLRRHFWGAVIDCLRHRPRNLEFVLAMIAFYLHLGTFARFLIADLDRQIAALDGEAARQPRPVAVAVPA
jgi:Domain of unknown function (DUF4070)